MTITNICEEVEQIFPNVGRPQIIKELDKVQKEFSREVRTITTLGELTNITSNVTWVLPAGFLELIEVHFYDPNGDPLYNGIDFYLAWKIKFNNIVFYSTSSDTIHNLPSNIYKCYLEYTRTSATISVITDVLEVEEDYHQAFVEKILERFYMRYPTIPITSQSGTFMGKDVPTARYHQANYERYRLEALRNKYKDKTDAGVVHYDHAGKFVLPKHTNIAVILPEL